MKAQKKKIVVRHNQLVESKMEISLMQMRIFLKTLSMIKQDDTDFKTYHIHINELLKEAGIKGKGWYDKMKQELKDLLQVHLEIPLGEKDFLLTHLYSSIQYEHGSGRIELSFDPKLRPYLLQVKGNFTMYELQHAIKMKSVYSIRMYELLRQYVGFGKRKFSVAYLREVLILNDKYKNFNGFKERVLEKARKDCQEYSDITFTYKLIYSGRSVSDIICYIKRKESSEPVPLPVLKESLEKEWLEAGISSQRLTEITTKHSKEYLTFVWSKAKQQKPKELAGFFLKALQEDYYKATFEGTQLEKQRQQSKHVQKAKKRKEDELKHQFHTQYVEARDETNFPITKADREAFEHEMKKRISKTPAFQIMFDTYLQKGTSIEFRDFLLKKYGQAHQYDLKAYKNSLNNAE